METKPLLNLIADDRRDAFNQFYNLYYDQVFRYSFYFLQEKEACREVVTNVFFSVWQSRKKLGNIANIETYLYVTARNEANRFLARRRKTHMVSLEDIPLHLETDGEGSAEDHLIASEIETLLTRAVNDLPEKCRMVFLMTREEGLTSKQIAEILDIRESTVRSQMKIAVDKIIAALKPHFPDLLFVYLLTQLF
jgi:RNA polymerase sigma-70 factor (ECF subfamily)